MKKLSAVIIMSMLALGCGSGLETNKEMTENPKFELAESNYYPITVIKSPQTKDHFGAFISIPEGFSLDAPRYEESGQFIFKHKDGITTFSVQIKANPGLNDAPTFMDMEVIGPNSKTFAFGKKEDITDWSTPMPMYEDTLSADASYSTVGYDRTVEDTRLTGRYFVWWFNYLDPKDEKANLSFSIYMTEECKKDEWKVFSPMFDLMRKSFFRLPSRIEVVAGRIKDELGKKDVSVALRITQDRLFALENGQPMAPGWETLIGKYRFAMDKEKGDVYLVPNNATASGLLPHPTRSGWTIDPSLDESLFSYIPLPNQPAIPPSPIKKSQP